MGYSLPSGWGQTSVGYGTKPLYEEDVINGGRRLLNPGDVSNEPSNYAGPLSKYQDQFRLAGYTGNFDPVGGESLGGDNGMAPSYDNPELSQFIKNQGLQFGTRNIDPGSVWAGGTINDVGLFGKEGQQYGNSVQYRDDFGVRDWAKIAAAALGGSALAGAGAGTVAGAGAVEGTGLTSLAGADAAAGLIPAGQAGAASLAGGGTGVAGAGFAASPSWFNNPMVQGAIKGGVKSAASGGNILTGAVTGGVSGGAGGGYLGSLASTVAGSKMGNNSSSGGTNMDFEKLVGGGVGAYENYRAGKDTQGQIDSLQSLFGQDSSYAKALRQTLERKDAAAGRRSQYGTREVELQARLAENASRLAPTLANLGMQRSGQRNQQYNSLLALLKGSGIPQNLLGSIQSYLNNNNITVDPSGMGIGDASAGYSSAADSEAAYHPSQNWGVDATTDWGQYNYDGEG